MSTPGLKSRAALAVGAGVLLANRLALRAGLRRRTDGWRRAAGLVLRGEAATFVLSAFGLRARSATEPPGTGPGQVRSHVAARLAAFLGAETEFHIRVRRGAEMDRAEGCARASYTLAFAPRVEGAARFVPPSDWSGRDAERETSGEGRDPLFNFVCRMGDDGGVDVWARVNHIGTDGVPAQELLTRLETAWGSAERVLYPAPREFAPHATPLVGRPGHGQVQAFIDFAPLLAWRKRMNAGLPEPLTISSALMWRLASHPDLTGRHIGTTVEVPALGGLGRGVGVVVVRPAEYLGRPDGLARYARDFARQIDQTRRRASGGCRALDAAAFVPARLCTALLKHALDRQPAAFGTLGLTILKDAKVFGAPLGDAGHADGFIALGGLALPTAEGGTVGCVTVKGPTARIASYADLLENVVRGCVDAG